MNYNIDTLREIQLFKENGKYPERLKTQEQKNYFKRKADRIEQNNGTYYEVDGDIRKKIILDENEKRTIVLHAYLSQSSSVAHRGFDVVHKHLFGLYANIPQTFVRDVINKTESKQVHESPKRVQVVSKTYSDIPGSQIAIDETEFINGFFILLAVDVASKKLYGLLKKKNFTKENVINLINAINIETKKTPMIICDNGSIFSLTKDDVPNRIVHTRIYTSQANGRIESYNKKVKELMMKYIDNGATISTDLFKKVLFSLNNNYNKTIKAVPAIANMDGRLTTVQPRVEVMKPKMVKGDKCRIQNTTLDLSLRKDVSYKSSHVRHWSEQIYEVARVVNPRTPTMARYYLLVGQADKRFYEHDLLKIPNSPVIKTTEVLGEKAKPEPQPKKISKQVRAQQDFLVWNNRYMQPASEKRERKQVKR